MRREVRSRAGNRCEYCRHPASYSCAPFVCEHVTPRVRGAGSSLADLAWAGGNALWNLRRLATRAPRREPIGFWIDFVRFNLLGRELSRSR